ncbi:GINS complex subunit [Tilletia horrida]|nr:GINS complex subunit [Tilletia horrida]
MEDDDDEQQAGSPLPLRPGQHESFPLTQSQDDPGPSSRYAHSSSRTAGDGREGPSEAGPSSARATSGGSTASRQQRSRDGPESSGSNRYGTPAGGKPEMKMDTELDDGESLKEITKLSRAWQEERGAPDILYWKGDVVDGVIDQIEQQVIERFAQHIASRISIQSRLSDVELGYVNKYNELHTAHLNTSVLNYLPEKLRILEDTPAADNMVVRPDLDEPVFIRCREDCGQIRAPDGNTVELGKNTIHLLRYNNVQSLVEQGRLELL